MDEVVGTEKPGTGSAVATLSKRKKSKARNGNIGTGVVNPETMDEDPPEAEKPGAAVPKKKSKGRNGNIVVKPETMDKDQQGVVENETPETGAALARKKSKGRNGNIVTGVVNPENMDEDPPAVVETEKPVAGATTATSSKRKKSKGRNGNIYIGVVNRIEWMKLQDQFGFKSVNNFGSFVLETMRRVHGDIQFWCDLAEASGVYPDLAMYQWNDGFPHAVNKEGQYFSPEADSELLSDEKREELVDLCKTMWEKRLQQLKQQQLQNESGGSNIPVVPPEDGEEEEAVDEMTGLENYLENLANGQYSTDVDVGGIVGQAAGGAEGGGQSSVASMLTHAEVNDIWNEQLSLAESVQNYGNLFNFINSIQGGDGSDQQQQCDNDADMGLEEAE